MITEDIMRTEKIAQLKQLYHDTLLEDIVPFWVNSDLIDQEYGGFIISGICTVDPASSWSMI